MRRTERKKARETKRREGLGGSETREQEEDQQQRIASERRRESETPYWREAVGTYMSLCHDDSTSDRDKIVSAERKGMDSKRKQEQARAIERSRGSGRFASGWGRNDCSRLLNGSGAQS